jgi:hypothetical protein
LANRSIEVSEDLSDCDEPAFEAPVLDSGNLYGLPSETKVQNDKEYFPNHDHLSNNTNLPLSLESSEPTTPAESSEPTTPAPMLLNKYDTELRIHVGAVHNSSPNNCCLATNRINSRTGERTGPYNSSKKAGCFRLEIQTSKASLSSWGFVPV